MSLQIVGELRVGMSYELFYSTGGHGGPYPNLRAAWVQAQKLILGNRNELRITIHSRAPDGMPVVRVNRHDGIEVFNTKQSQWIIPLYAVEVNGLHVTNGYALKVASQSYEDLSFGFMHASLLTPAKLTLNKTVAPGCSYTLLEGEVMSGEYKATHDDMAYVEESTYREKLAVYDSILPKLEEFIKAGGY